MWNFLGADAFLPQEWVALAVFGKSFRNFGHALFNFFGFLRR